MNESRYERTRENLPDFLSEEMKELMVEDAKTQDLFTSIGMIVYDDLQSGIDKAIEEMEEY